MELSDYQIEKLLVKKFFTDSEYLHFIYENYNNRFFENQNVNIILKLLTSYFKKYNKKPSEDVLKLMIQNYVEKEKKKDNELDDKEIILEFDSCVNFKTDDDEAFVKDSILNFVKSKRIYYTIFDNLDTIEKRKDVSSCIQDFQKITNLTLDYDLGFDYFKDQDKHWDRLNDVESKYKTGFECLDFAMNGGVPKSGKNLIVFMAQTHVGKSLMMSNLAVNKLKQNLRVGIITLEMSEDVYGARIDAHISKEDVNKLQYNTETARERIESFRKLYPQSNLIIKEFPPSTINCNTIQGYLEKLYNMDQELDILFVDYLTLLLPNNLFDQNLYQKGTSVSEELRALSYKFGIPIISACQSNREGWNNSDIDIQHVSESAGIANTVDFFAALWQQEGDREAGKLNLKILKNRLGGMAGMNYELGVNYSNLLIQDIIQERSEAQNESRDLEEEIDNDLSSI